MKKLTELLAEIDTLKAELDKLKPFKREDEERLWKKFRLEWNYNSNHIEGNTLTYGQTELLLIFDKTTGDHDMREYEEMKAHDVAIKLVQEYAADKVRELTESDIRQLNEIILVRPYWGNAQTPDGQHTRKLIEPGVYKREPNSVRLQNGEMFHYASPGETPAKMKELMDWYRKAELDSTLHPVYVAAKMHYDFVRIHPFDDSNGRTSRLLMNYVLLRNGFPPIIIKSSDKKNYLLALNKADVGDFDAFVEYIAKDVVWSINKAIVAAKGENIEDVDDLSKEIKVWKKSIKSKISNSPIKSVDGVWDLYANCLSNLFKSFIKTDKDTFDDLFYFNRINFYADGTGQELREVTDLELYLNKIFEGYSFGGRFYVDGKNQWELNINHQNSKIAGLENLFVPVSLKIEFLVNYYSIYINDSLLFKNSYSTRLTEDEEQLIIKAGTSYTFDAIKAKQK